MFNGGVARSRPNAIAGTRTASSPRAQDLNWSQRVPSSRPLAKRSACFASSPSVRFERRSAHQRIARKWASIGRGGAASVGGVCKPPLAFEPGPRPPGRRTSSGGPGYGRFVRPRGFSFGPIEGIARFPTPAVEAGGVPAEPRVKGPERADRGFERSGPTQPYVNSSRSKRNRPPSVVSTKYRSITPIPVK